MQEKDILFKQRVVERFEQSVNEKVFTVQKMLQELIDSTANETKSSAGDKYETGRAMLQIEQDNVRKRLSEALNQKALFHSLDRLTQTSQVSNGSLVKTNQGYFYVSVGLGKIQTDGVTVFAISPKSPLGSKLLGMKTLDNVTINGVDYLIENIT